MTEGPPEQKSPTRKASTRVAVFSPHTTGHNIEYTRHLIRYWEETAPTAELTVIVPSTDPYEKLIARCGATSIRIDSLTSADRSWLRASKTLIQRSLRTWKIMSRHCCANRIDHCFAINLNNLTFALGWYARSPQSFRVSGILYYPHIRFNPRGPVERVEWCRKEFQLRWLLRNPRISTIFLLNDPAGARLLNRRSGSSVFRALPDPVPAPPIRHAARDRIADAYTLDRQRTFCLVFGSINRRKGVSHVLKAMRRLDSDLAARMALLIVGPIQEDLKAELEQLVRKIRIERPGLLLRVEDRFVTKEHMFDLFAAADVVLLPYQRGEASSGVLGHAAAAGTVVLGPDMGLMGRLIRKYQLGATVDTRSVPDLATGISAMVRNDNTEMTATFDPCSAADFVAERDPRLFTGRIAKALVPEQ